ncbi:plasmid recombination protein [Staphylococcus epidermidis]|nr:plasmid recombination protein [Staphylococcus epidermidis]MCT1762702.1 plasmid recombination protein [Staphylococcus epidermidis]MCT1830904.1 plasmid recombination protein [Staphylococcus epidermidis]MDH9058785.1 plasmid recombination protein [Staphylococcus epidermidis]MDH9609730.1 plasmid recombination protein [Staphylococcus epidermidis]MDI0071057.1 plasmid recombination protein [Staphylococcus epidermidis]
MSYSIIKVEKFNYENEDIDHSKNHLNYDLIND